MHISLENGTYAYWIIKHAGEAIEIKSGLWINTQLHAVTETGGSGHSFGVAH